MTLSDVVLKFGTVGLIASLLLVSPVQSQQVESRDFRTCGAWEIGANRIEGDKIVSAFECLFAKIEKLEQELRPFKVARGAVVAFDRDRDNGGTCPRGWDYYEPAGGRFIVGAGQHSNIFAGVELNRYPSHMENAARAVGGAEKHKLSIAEMPSHSHGVAYGVDGDRKAGMNNDPDHSYHGTGALRIPPEGGGQAHNNMPPYVALFYCIKN